MKLFSLLVGILLISVVCVDAGFFRNPGHTFRKFCDNPIKAITKDVQNIVKILLPSLVTEAVQIVTGIPAGGCNGYGTPYYTCWNACLELQDSEDQDKEFCKSHCGQLRDIC